MNSLVNTNLKNLTMSYWNLLNKFKNQMYEIMKDSDKLGREGYQEVDKLCDLHFDQVHEAIRDLVIERTCIDMKKKGEGGSPEIISYHCNRKETKRKSTNLCLK